MKGKKVKRLFAVCLFAALALSAIFGAAFMKSPSEAEAEEIKSYSETEDYVLTIEADSFSEGETYETEDGVRFEYDKNYGGFKVTGHRDENFTRADIPDAVSLSVSKKTYTYPVVRVEEGAFDSCDKIVYERVGRYVNYIGPEAFYYNRYVENLDFYAEDAYNGQCDAYEAGEERHASPFYYSGYMAAARGTLTIGKNVKRIDRYMFAEAFWDSYEFEKGSILTEIDDYAFSEGGGGTSREIGDIKLPDTVESVGERAFFDFGGHVSGFWIPENLTHVGKNAFGVYYADSIHFNAVNFPDCDSDLQPFYRFNFYSLTYLSNSSKGNSGAVVYIGKKVERIPAYCFYGKKATTSTDIGIYITGVFPESYYTGEEDDGTYALSSVGTYAFWNADLVDYYVSVPVVLPMGLEVIEPYAFYESRARGIKLGDASGWHVTYADGSAYDEHLQYLFGEEYMSDPSCAASYLRNDYCDLRFVCSDGFEYVLSSDEKSYLISAYTGSEGEVALSETHRGKAVTGVAAEAFEGNAVIKSVTVPENISEIGKSAFSGCTSLSSVTIRGGGLVYVGAGAFSGCTSLKSLSVTSVSDFVSVNFGDTDANPLAAVSANGGTFFAAGDSYTEISISSAERIGTYALAGCTAIEKVTIGECVEKIGAYAFFGNSSLCEIFIPSSVRLVGEYAFFGTGISEVTFSETGGWKIYDLLGNLAAKLSASEVASYGTGYLTGTYAGYVWKNEKTNYLVPIICGMSEIGDVFYTNGDIALTAVAAEGSGILAIYWTDPEGVEHTEAGADFLVLEKERLVCGTYTFRCEDTDGNLSAEYQAVFDDVPPEIYATGAEIFDGYVGGEFTVIATDGLSPVTLYCSFAGGDIFSCGGDEYAVHSSSGDGVYSFFAEDAAGNVCGEYTLILDTAVPEGRWETEETGSYALSFVWDNPAWSCVMDGAEYFSKSPITEEGGHTATLTTLSGNAKSFSTYLSHNFVVTSVQSGNCEEGGTALYVCTYCGASYTAEFSAAGGHSYVLEIVEPACETGGHTVSVCEVCGEYDISTYTYLSPLGHSVYETERAATCEEDGFCGGICVRCGMEFDGTVIPATGHLWIVSACEAGCETEGYRATVCLRCSEVKSFEKIEALGHDFVERARSDATCEAAAVVTYRCTRCSATYEETVGGTAEHDYSVVTLEKEATCGAEGERRLTCSVCGEFVIEVIPALSHVNVETGRYRDDETGETFVTYECSLCGESFTVGIGDVGATASSGVISLMDTYTKYMWWILLATVAAWSIFMGVRYAMARNSDEKARAKSMIVSYVAGIVVIAVILVACPYLVYAIALLAG